MLLMSYTDIVTMAMQNFDGILSVFYFISSLPSMFMSFMNGLPYYFQIGIYIVSLCIFVVVILKLKTYILF